MHPENISNLDQLPSPIALVARRYNISSPNDLATRFLNASYLAECFLKLVAIVLQSKLESASKDLAYRQAYTLVNADGLGSWEQSIREMTSGPATQYMGQDFFPLLSWLTKKQKNEDLWFNEIRENLSAIYKHLGVGESIKLYTVRDLINCLVRIRNMTKAHGAVSELFYSECNIKYIKSITSLIDHCPVMKWNWYHILKRDLNDYRTTLIIGTSPHSINDRLDYSSALEDGVYLSLPDSNKLIFCGNLIRSERDCVNFYFPNGGTNQAGHAEFINYESGKTEKYLTDKYKTPPAPLSKSSTEGFKDFEIQSNVFGNLPPKPKDYVKRPSLELVLEEKILDQNHHIITLHGGGGMGKTSLALAVAHKLSSLESPPFEHIVWFSARDVDLKPSGPIDVHQSVADLNSISSEFGYLFFNWGGKKTIDSLAEALKSPKSVSSKSILFIFDNFETIADISGLHKFLDKHTHLPNKVLLTSRERSFVADYPIEVHGMEEDEAQIMLQNAAKNLGITHLMSDEVINKIYSHTGGHAYIMRVIAGEMAKDGRYTPPIAVIGKRQDIVQAVFERSFNKLSEAGRNVFLLVANWKANVFELGLIVILGVRGIDAVSGIEECKRLSLIQEIGNDGDVRLYTVPVLARSFANKKLQGDPDRLIIQQDLSIIQKSGFQSSSLPPKDQTESFVKKFILICNHEAKTNPGSINKYDQLLEVLAQSWPLGWLNLADFRTQFSLGIEKIQYALRRSVEENPHNKNAWVARYKYANKIGDTDLEIASLVGAVESSPTDISFLSDVADRLSVIMDNNKDIIRSAQRGMYLSTVRLYLERVANRLDPTGLSRLAWLFLYEENKEKALHYAKLGLEKDPNNIHCAKIVKRLSKKQK